MIRLFAEPTLHFFVIGLLLFVAHRAFVEDPRTIVITPALEAELARRFRDQTGRRPSPAELELAVSKWKRDEALYREALREGLDREDATVRAVLADKIRARVALQLPQREPSEADLARWLATHRSDYERPRRYAYEAVEFPKASGSAVEQVERYERALAAGETAAALRHPIVGANPNEEELRQRFGPTLAKRIIALPLGTWQRLETDDAWLLVRLNRIDGGLPDPVELRRRLIADQSLSAQERAVEQAVQRIVDRYRFEERR